MKIAIVTDSTASLTNEVKQNKDLYILPIPVIIDGKVYEVIDEKTIYQQMKNAHQFPTTSQPSIGQVIELYDRLLQDGYDHIISIHISSGISGFCHTLQGIVNSDFSKQVTVFDSCSTSLPMGIMVEQACQLVKQNKTKDEIIQQLIYIRNAQQIYLIVDDLNHLVRSGRLSNGTALIGNLLKIKPILQFDEEGHIVLKEKIRTAKKAYKTAEQLICDELFIYQAKQWKPILGIAHANDEQKAMELADKLHERTQLPVKIVDLGAVIGAHTGEKTIGFGIMRNIIEEEI